MLRVESFLERLRSVFLTCLASAVLFLGSSIALSAQTASLEVQSVIEEGSAISVTWTGPGNPGDFLAISEPGAPAGEFLGYSRTSGGSPAKFKSLAIGDYELRYVHAADLSILARASLKIVAPDAAAAMTAPSVTMAGAAIDVGVSDPGDPEDYVTIVAEGLPDDAFGPYARLQGRSSVTLDAPNQAGTYEIRQVRAAGQIVLNRQPLTVEPQAAETPEITERAAPKTPAVESPDPDLVTTALRPQPAPAALPSATVELMALVAVDPSREFGVALSAPVIVEARLVIVPEGQEASSSEMSVGAERILRLTAPAVSGLYEIRLIAVDSGAVITSRPLEVR